MKKKKYQNNGNIKIITRKQKISKTEKKCTMNNTMK